MSKIKMRIVIIAACVGTFTLAQAQPVMAEDVVHASTARKKAKTSTGTKPAPNQPSAPLTALPSCASHAVQTSGAPCR